MGEEGRPLSKRKAKALAARESWAKKKERRKAANAAAKARAEERAAKKLQKQQGGDQEQGAAGGAGAAGDNGPTTAPQKDSVPDPESDQGHGEDTGDGMPDVDMSAWRLFALHPLLEKGLAMQGFTTPTEIQAAVLPAATRDCADIIGAAQTGSGKTLAFGLPIMQRLLQVGGDVTAGCQLVHGF
jgi:ATP-dependent RNA helicase DDX24/MAK5